MRGHTLYVPGDFTVEEIARENKIAVLVIDGGLSICKMCGDGEIGLDTFCRASKIIMTKPGRSVTHEFEYFKGAWKHSRYNENGDDFPDDRLSEAPAQSRMASLEKQGWILQ